MSFFLRTCSINAVVDKRDYLRMTGIISFHWKHNMFLQDSAKTFLPEEQENG